LILTDDEDLYKRARAWHDHGHAYDESVDRGNDPAYSLGFNYRMTELQGAIGIEQLKKLNFILDCNRANKQLLKNQLIDQGFKGEFRRLTDPEEIADTLVFSLPTEALADKFATELRKQGIATKNIPDAMKWHYARHWSSILEHASQTSREKAAIDDTGRLLRRSIATPIFVKMTPESISGLADKLLTVSRKVL
jgi:8-amino-3,8-dideoxy-alpha-D-manno-octulosonate transaminase